MKQYFITLFFLFILTLFFGCQNVNKELVNSADQAREKKVLDSLNKFDSIVYVNKSTNSSIAITYARHALALTQNRLSPYLLVKIYLIMGSAYFNTKIDTSFYYLTEALKVANQYNIGRQKPMIFFDLSKIYNVTFDYKTSLVLLDSVIRLGTLFKNFDVLSSAYNSIGMIKYNLHDSANAKSMFDSAFKIAESNSLYKQMGVTLGNLALYEHDSSKSIRLQENAIQLLQKTPGNEEAIALLLINIGNKCLDPDSAIHYYLTAINIVGSGISNEILIAANNNLAYSYLAKHDFSNAEKCLSEKAIILAEKDQNYEWLSALYDTYSDVLLAQRKGTEAAIIEKRAYQNREKAYDKQATGQVRLLAALLGLKNKELRIQENERGILKKETRIQQLTYLFVISFLLAGFVVFIILWIAQRNKLRFQKQLVTSARRVIDLEENMKGRLSMELHDMTSPLYNTLLRQIETTEIPDSVIKHEIQVKLTQLADSIRQISHKISKVYIEHLSFDELARGLCVDMQELTQARINLDIELSGISLSSEKATHMIRIIQELLTNAVKYVKTGEINLSISVEFKNINIIYHDNGPGFDQQSMNLNGIGLMNIQERAKLLGGKATLKSWPHKGTHWIICIPYG